MSHQETYDLSWHTYPDHLRTMLHDMMVTANLSDVTLVSDDNKQIRAHKFVLSYSSPVFKNIIGNLNNDAMIFLRGIMHQELTAILEFLYVGQVSIPKDRVDEFFKVASDLQIQSLWQRNQERSDARNSRKKLRDVKYEDNNDENVSGQQNHCRPIIINPTIEEPSRDKEIDPLKENESNDEDDLADNVSKVEENADAVDINSRSSEKKLSPAKSSTQNNECNLKPIWMDAEWLLKSNGKSSSKVLELDGFFYKVSQQKRKRLYLQCLKYRSRDCCRARAVIDLEKNIIIQISSKDEHNHGPDTAAKTVKYLEEAEISKGVEDGTIKSKDLYKSLKENIINSNVGEKGLSYLTNYPAFCVKVNRRREKFGVRIKMPPKRMKYYY